jgi:hypothetical protein
MLVCELDHAPRRAHEGRRACIVVCIPEAGHFPVLERTAPLFGSVISCWLRSRFPAP